MINNILDGSSSTVPTFNCSSIFITYANGQASFVDHNDIYNSAGGTAYGGSTCADQTGTFGNISADPQFVSPATANFHLSAGSPAIDAGNNSEPGMPATDLDNNPRIQDATGLGYPVVDMGVYEYPGLQDAAVTTAAVAITGNNDPNRAGGTSSAFAAGTTLSLTVTVTSSTGVVPTGTVTLLQNDVAIGSASLNASGDAIFQTSALTPGAYAFTANYSGASGFAPSSSVKIFTSVADYVPVISLASSVNPSLPGESVIFTGTITSPDNAALSPVVISDQSLNTTLATLDSSSGSFTYITSSLAPGAHNIAVSFAGDATHSSATGGTIQQVEYNPAVTFSITSAGSPVTTVTSGTVVKLTAKVMKSATLPASGQVEFCDNVVAHCTDIHLLSTAQLSSTGTATFLFVPGPGKHDLQVNYLGVAGLILPATSAISPLIVTASGSNPTTTTLTASGGPGNYTLVATVTGSASVNGAPTGTITLEDATNADYDLGTAPLGIGAGGLGFVNFATPATGDDPIFLVTGNFDTEYNPYLAVANAADNTVSILEEQPNGSFITTQTIATGTDPLYMAAADFNGDGVTDLAVLNAGSRDVSILLSNGNGTFSQSTLATSYLPTTIAVGDFNGDGITDLEVTDLYYSPPYIPEFDAYYGKAYPPGSFAPATDPIYPTPSTSIDNGPASTNENVAVAVGDFNGDYKPDIAVVEQTDDLIGIFLGVGSGFNPSNPGQSLPEGSFNRAPNVPVGNSPRSIAAGDFNSDGNEDLAVTNYGDNTVSILLSNGDGTFTTSTLSVGKQPIGIAVGDFNGDGIPDLAVANSGDNTVTVLLGTGDGTFTPLTPIPVGTTPTAITVGDFNRDGQQDIAVTDAGDNTVTILVSRWSGATSVTIPNISPLPNGFATHQVVAAYSGNAVFAPSSSNAVSLSAAPASTTLVLTANPDAALVGQQAVFTATLSPLAVQGTAPSGTITFSFDGAALGTATVANGIATFSTSSLPLGTDNIQAVYSGDGNFGSSTSNTLAYVVSNPVPTVSTTTTLFANPLSAYAGNTITFKSTTIFSGAGPTPTGVVTLMDGTTAISTSPITASGTTWIANFSIDTLAAGTHTITAVYPGTALYESSTSNSITITMLPNSTSLLLSSPLDPAHAYQAIPLTAQLSSMTTTAFPGGGTVTFFANGSAIGTASLSLAGTAAFNASLPVGLYSLTASFAATTSFGSSNSGNIRELVTADATSTLLTASPTPSYQNNPITLTAQVMPASSNTAPTGTVTFYDATTLLGTAALDATGHASLAATFTTATTHDLTGVFSPGDSNFITSTSAPFALVISPQIFTITAPSTFTLQTEHHGSFSITLASVGNFADSIAFDCGNLPPIATCTFSNNPLILSADGTAATTVSIETDAVPDFQSELQHTGITLAILLPFALLALRRRRISTRLLAILLCIAASSLTACSGKYPASTPPGTYSIAIIGQGTATHVMSTTSVTFVVTQ